MIKNSFEEQYSEKETEYLKFQQMKNESKVAIVDDVNFIDKHNIKRFILELSKEFNYIILGSKKEWKFDIRTEIKQELEIFKSFDVYEIQDFYSDKRLDLIKKVCDILKPKDVYNINEYSRKINKFIHNQIKLFNLNPDYIIHYTKNYCNNYSLYSSNNEAFSKVYEANIIKALEVYDEKGGVDTTFKLLGKIAYYIHFNKRYPLCIEEFIKIIEEYNERYDQDVKPMNLFNTITKSKIMKYVDNSFNIKFTNNSYLAYFVAREIISKYNRNSDTEDLENILKNICFGINSDIILFLSYLSNNLKILNYIYLNAQNYMSGWEEYSIDKGNIKFLDIITSKLEVALPNKTDKQKITKMEVEAEKETTSKELIETTDIYDYNERDVDLFVNKIIKSLKYTEIISRILPSFEHELIGKEKKEFVKAIYSFPNRVLYYFLHEIDDNKETFINDLSEIISKNKKNINQKEVEKSAISILENISIILVIKLFDNICNLATNRKTIRYLDDFDYNQNSNYKIQNLMMHESLGNIEAFINKSKKIYSNSDKRIIKLIIKNIVRNYLLTHDNISKNNKQKLEDRYFSKEEKKYLLKKRKKLK